MVNETEFKQVRKKYQGKYFRYNLGAGYITYRHIIKVDFYRGLADLLIFHYNYYFLHNCIERKYSIRRAIPDVEVYFGERITPSEYKRNIKEHRHDEYV